MAIVNVRRFLRPRNNIPKPGQNICENCLQIVNPERAGQHSIAGRYVCTAIDQTVVDQEQEEQALRVRRGAEIKLAKTDARTRRAYSNLDNALQEYRRAIGAHAVQVALDKMSRARQQIEIAKALAEQKKLSR